MSLDTLLKRLDALRDTIARSLGPALDAEADAIASELQATGLHGDDTGATRASYTAYRVGGGRTGNAALAAAVAAGAILNPGYTATSRVTLPKEALGVILTNPMTYHADLAAQRRSPLPTTLIIAAESITAAAADASRKALS